MRPLARVALAVALTPTAILTLVFADRLWVTAIRPELLNLRARRAGMRIDGPVARSVTSSSHFDHVHISQAVERARAARAAHEQDMADMAGEERAS